MNLEELKKVVEKATPGEWMATKAGIVFAASGHALADCRMDVTREVDNAEFIATFNPSLVSKLLNAAECLKHMREEYAKLPHSLGYDFTHLPKIDAALRDLEQS